jgi:hypothetical protein
MQARRRDRRAHRRASRREGLRHLRDWRSWGIFPMLFVAFLLSGALADSFWPASHGFLTHVVARGILGSAVMVVAAGIVMQTRIARAARANRDHVD